MLALKKRSPDVIELEHLKSVPLFSDIHGNEEALAELARAVTRARYAPGEEIITENEAGAEMFILIQGTASVFRHTAEGEVYRVTILRGAEHAFFGEGALLDADARSATIRADEECICLVLGREAFAEFGRNHPAWAFPVLVRIARAVMTRLRKTNQDLTLLYNALVTEIRGQ
jgi:CRP-like cAMP-binding protein